LYLLHHNSFLIVKDRLLNLLLVEIAAGSLAVTGLHQIFEVHSVSQIGIFPSLSHEVHCHLLVRLKEVLLEGSVSSFLEILVLDVLQVGSLLGRINVLGASLDSLGLGLDAINDILSSSTDFIHERGLLGLVSDELIIRAGLKSFTAKSRVIHKNGLKNS